MSALLAGLNFARRGGYGVGNPMAVRVVGHAAIVADSLDRLGTSEAPKLSTRHHISAPFRPDGERTSCARPRIAFKTRAALKRSDGWGGVC